MALLTFFLTFTAYVSSAQTWRWATAAGGPGNQQAYAIATDAAGNQYVGGEFSSTAHFGSLTVSGADSSSGFIAKIDSAGQWLWVKTLTGPSTQSIRKVVVSTNGKLFLLGYATAGSAFDGTPITAGNGVGVVACLSAATGAVQWVTRGDGIRDLTLDASEKPFVCGSFQADSLQLGSVTIRNTSPWYSFSPHIDAFVASIAPTTGAWDWATAVGGGGYEDGYKIAADGLGNIYLGGQYVAAMFVDTTFIGPFELPSTTNVAGNLFLAKLTPARTWEWAISTETVDWVEITGLAVRADGVAYMSGTFSYGDLTIGHDTIATVTNSMFATPFIACISPTGQVRWGAQTNAGYDGSIKTLSANAAGSVFIAGTVAGDSLQFGGTAVHLPAGTTNGYFTAALDSTGEWAWAMPLPAAEMGVFALAPQRRMTFAGSLYATTAFGTHSLLNTSGQADGFAAQLALPPFVHRFAPATGPAGTVVTLRGEGFQGVTAVLFGTLPATSFTVLPDGSIQVTVPPGVSTLGVVIQVVGVGGTGQSVGVFGRGPQGLPAEAQAATFELWPNPAHSLLHLRARDGQALGAVTVRDAVGRVVRHYAGGPAQSAELSLVGLPGGLYVVQTGSTTRRLVVE